MRLYLGPAPSASFSSSILLKLTIKVAYLDDYLFILDGRFNQLQTLHVDLDHTFSPRRIQNEVSFPILNVLELSKKRNQFCLERNPESEVFFIIVRFRNIL